MIIVNPNKIRFNDILIGEEVLFFTRSVTSHYNQKYVIIEYVMTTKERYINYKLKTKRLELENQYLGTQWDLTLYETEVPLILDKTIITDFSTYTQEQILSDWQIQNQIILNEILKTYNLQDTDYQIVDDLMIDYSEIEAEIQSLLEQQETTTA